MMTMAARSLVLLVAVLAMAACSTQAPGTGGPAGTGTPGASPTASGAPPAAGTPTGAPPVGLDACGIVTTAEVEAVVGSVVTAESGGEPDDGSTFCTFETAEGEGLFYTAYDPDGVAGMEAWKSSSDVQTIPGLGDEAIYQESIGLMVRRGTATYQFYPLGDVDGEEALALATQLAQAASARF